MTDVLTERARIEEQVSGRTLVDALADTVAAHGDEPAYSDRHGAPDGPDEGAWRTLTWNETREAALDAGVALSENLLGGVFVNQSAAFSDFHGTGANPAANASYTDGAYVASRFRVVQSRRHVE